MRNILITFGGRRYDETTANVVNTPYLAPLAETWIYDDKWLVERQDLNGEGYYDLNRWLWQTRRQFGFGWCAWKPYIILDALARLNNGDVVLYVDADCVPIADLSIVFGIARRDGLMLFDCQGYTNRMMTRHDCLIAMGLDTPEVANAKAACARFCAFTKGSFLAQQILFEWYTYSINPMCQEWNWGPNAQQYRSAGDRGPSRYAEEFPELHRHSTEQSVLAALATKYGVQLYREACQYGWPVDVEYCSANNVIGDLYPQLFEQRDARGPRTLEGSRFRNVSLIGGIA